LHNKTARDEQVKVGMLRMGKSGASKEIVDYLNFYL